MRKLSSICCRLRRRYGVRFVVISRRRGFYEVYMYSFTLRDWSLMCTCAGVAEVEDYLSSFERAGAFESV